MTGGRLAPRLVVGLGLVATLLLAAPTARAHETRPGFLELKALGAERVAVLWKEPTNDAVPIDLDPVLPETWKVLEEMVVEPSLESRVWRATLSTPGGLEGARVAVARLDTSFTDVLLRVVREDGREETHLLTPVKPWARVGSASSGAFAYLRLGVQHILLGADHLLFVLGLLLIVRRRWMLVKTVTAFTVAHSLTLAAATLGVASVPTAPLNAAIALSILFLGPEVVRAARGGTSLTIRHPWVVAFLFGLLHGFGFATGLSAMGLPRSEIPLALLLFNVGVEVGQLAFVALVLLLVRSFRVLEVRWPRGVRALPAYAVGSLGAYWTIRGVVVLLGGTT